MPRATTGPYTRPANCCRRANRVFPPASLGHGLQQTEIRIRGHLAHERHERIGREDAIRVEHDHEIVTAAPIRHEVLQVADLAADVVGAAPVPNAHSVAELFAKRVIRRRLLDVELGARRVRKNEQLEARGLFLEQRLRHREQRGERAGRILVVDGHDERRALLDARLAVGSPADAAEQHAGDRGRGRQRRSSRT